MGIREGESKMRSHDVTTHPAFESTIFSENQKSYKGKISANTANWYCLFAEATAALSSQLAVIQIQQFAAIHF